MLGWLLTVDYNMAGNESFAATGEKYASFADNEQVIEPYMFELNKEDHGDTSWDSSEDSSSEEEELKEVFEAANVWRCTTL